MKIFYGVQGTGNGHIARARVMAKELKKRNMDVDFFFTGRDENEYFSMEKFGNYSTNEGMSFYVDKGKVDLFKTATKNSIPSLYSQINDLDLSGYDLVLNDFEPVSAWAAKKQKVPSIGISHQNAFRYSVPKKGYGLVDKVIIHHFAPTDIQLGLHWFHFNQPILPPIVDLESTAILTQEPFILVYLPFESLDEIKELLSRFKTHQFVLFHPTIKKEQVEGNLNLNPLSHERFLSHLYECEGVIANGGFELPSEAISLGKKLLLKPLLGQFEQQSNVATLESLGLAKSMEVLNPCDIRSWLGEESAQPIHFPNVAEAIVEWVEEGDWTETRRLVSKLWKQVELSQYQLN